MIEELEPKKEKKQRKNKNETNIFVLVRIQFSATKQKNTEQNCKINIQNFKIAPPDPTPPCCHYRRRCFQQ